ncbi:MAG: TylF/MycF/NovP-related O-methyltransferase [Planctomycetota bacterium]
MKKVLRSLGLYGLDKRLKSLFRITKSRMSFAPWGKKTEDWIRASIDVVRFSSIALAFNRIKKEQIPGEIAEIGVYKGKIARFMRHLSPDRRMHLFDTFEGFSKKDFETPEEGKDRRFKDTNAEAVHRKVLEAGNPGAEIVMHVGFFPDTAVQLDKETFCFISLDVDKYAPTLAGLEVMFPRLEPGGYIFIHDYNSEESNRGVSRAVDEWIKERPESIFDIPDQSGSIVIRKLKD